MMWQFPDSRREYQDRLGGVEAAWTMVEAEPINLPLRKHPFKDGANRLATDLTDDEVALSPLLQNAFAPVRAAAETEGFKLTARDNLAREIHMSHWCIEAADAEF